jgi:hypothetical protein
MVDDLRDTFVFLFVTDSNCLSLLSSRETVPQMELGTVETSTLARAVGYLRRRQVTLFRY